MEERLVKGGVGVVIAKALTQSSVLIEKALIEHAFPCHGWRSLSQSNALADITVFITPALAFEVLQAHLAFCLFAALLSKPVPLQAPFIIVSFCKGASSSVASSRGHGCESFLLIPALPLGSQPRYLCSLVHHLSSVALCKVE